MSGVARTTSKSVQPFTISSARSSAPTKSAPASLGQRLAFRAGEDEDAHGAAGAIGQRHNAAHLLVRMARVDAHAQVNFDGLIELGAGKFFDQASACSGA
jgi:hypothetical protein